MDAWQEVLTVFLGAGGLAFLGMVGRGLWRWFTGRAARELSQNRSYLSRMREAEAERDWSDAYRRVVAEHASEVRGIVERAGLGDQLPEWPVAPPRPTASK